MDQLQNTPALKFVIFFATGILIGSEYSFNINALIIFVILFAVLILLSAKNPAAKFTFTICLIILTGILKSNIDFSGTHGNSIEKIPDTQRKSNVKLTGIINEIPDYDSSRIRFSLVSQQLIIAQDTIEVNGDVLVTIREDMFSKTKTGQPILEAGDKVILIGKLSEAAVQRNPGEFDYRKYLLIHNINKTFITYGYDNIGIISKDNLSYFYQKILIPSKQFALNTIDKNISGDQAAYLKGLVTGERSEISAEMKSAFIDAGVMHLIAVSGLNVAYLIISVTVILSIFRIPLLPRIFITILFLIYYCIFTGNSPSIVRATIMGALVLISFLLERRINFYNIIGVSAMIILIYDSKQLFDAGFILSYSATLSMAILLSIFEKIFLIKIRSWRTRGKKLTLWVAVLFFTSLAAQLGTLPITAIYFGKISVISLLANIVAVPLANLSLAIGFFQIMAAIFSDYLSSVIAETNNLLLSVQISFIQWCSSLDIAYMYAPQFSLSHLLCYYFSLLLILTAKDKRKVLFRLILCGIIISAFYIYNFDFSKKLRVTFLDIGQGDCALIQTPDNKTILVDCGTLTFTYNSGERTIAPFLRRNGIKNIDLMIVTHLHNDHIGGINYLLENFKVGKVIESGQKYETPFTYTMDSLILYKNIPRVTVRCGDVIDDLKDMRFYFLFPTDKFVNDEGQSINNNLNNGSVVFKLKYKEVEMFFGGDIEKEGERFLYETFSDFLKSDILKVSHHGSITSTTIPFIIKNKPEFAVISCGMYNKYNHPSDIVLSRLQNTGTKYYRTDLEGAVMFESNGYVIDLVDWK